MERCDACGELLENDELYEWMNFSLCGSCCDKEVQAMAQQLGVDGVES